MIIECFVDGAARGQGQKNMGEAACAVVICKNRKPIAQFARGLGKRTNNEAEYEAVLQAVLMCAMSDLHDPIIYSDSSVVVNQVEGKWVCSNAALQPLLLSILAIKESYNFRIVQVPRFFVAIADAHANEFLDKLEEFRS